MPKKKRKPPSLARMRAMVPDLLPAPKDDLDGKLGGRSGPGMSKWEPLPTNARLYERSYHRDCEGELLVEVRTVYTENRCGRRVSAVTDVVLKTGNGSWSLVYDVHGVLHLQHYDKLDKRIKR